MKWKSKIAIAAEQPFSPFLAKDLNNKAFYGGRYTVDIDAGAGFLKEIPLRFLDLATHFLRERRKEATRERNVSWLSG